MVPPASDAATGGTPTPGASVRAAVSVLLTWVLPGLGHAYLGRPRRALLYGCLVTFMFGFGLVLEGALSTPRDGSYLSVLATIADLGNGALYGLARLAGWSAGRVASATHEIGNTFHWTAGVLNMLLMLDAHDIAVGRK